MQDESGTHRTTAAATPAVLIATATASAEWAITSKPRRPSAAP